MGEALFAAPGQSVELSLTVENYRTSGIYPRATVYNPSGLAVAVVDLVHVADGRWAASYTLPSSPIGIYDVHYKVYTDSGYTTLSANQGGDQDRIVTDFRAFWDELRASSGVAGSYGEALKVVLGITGKANMRIDNTVYDGNGFLQQARIRVFPDAATAAAATVDATVPEGEIATVDLTGVADAIHLSLPDSVLGLLS